MAKPMAEAADRLADVLDRENAALKAMDLPRAAALLPEKTAAIAALDACGQAGGPPDPSLVAVARRLDGLALENRCLLERAMTAQSRVIGIVVRAAAAAAVRPSYGGGGRPARLAAMALSTRA